MREYWTEYAKKADFELWSRELHITPLSARILRNRDVESLEEARLFLSGTMADLSDPYLMKDMEKGEKILAEAIRKKERVAIVTDYDDDGIFGGEILYEGILKAGGSAVIYYPDRTLEGYGINERIIEDVKAEGCGLILTCDNGIAAPEEIARAKEMGLKVIVTDHHEPGEKIPAADAVIDPKQPDCPYPFKSLCGAGVAYRLIQALFRDFRLPQDTEEAFLEYLAIATVADVVELKGENRIIVKAGLEKLRKTPNVGLRALMNACAVRPENLTAEQIGFIIAPCFNTLSRLETPEPAFALLREQNESEAARIAHDIRDLNGKRKKLQEEGIKAAEKLLAEKKEALLPIIFACLSGVNESVIGIVAGKLKEKYNRPAFVFTDCGNGLKGSGRSVEGYHMQKALLSCGDLLQKFGGHAMAAGLSLEKENLPLLEERLLSAFPLSEEELVKKVRIDARLPLSYISESLCAELDSLGPFGNGFSKPVFARPHFRVKTLRLLGEGSTVKMTVTEDGTLYMDALLFGDAEGFLSFLKENFGEEEVEKALSGRDNTIDIALTFYPSVNEFRGIKSLQIVCQSYCVIR